jgi:hypothetical protein
MIRASTACYWCEQPFRLRRGGSPQRFCGTACRSAFWSALRRWGERAIAAGILTIDDIRNGNPEACTLLPGRVSPAPACDAALESPSRVVPRAESDYTRQTAFEQLLARTIAARRR